jgi:hypothetical protein
MYLLNGRSESCNPSSSIPASYWYNYGGVSYDNATQAIYFIQTTNDTANSTFATSFQNMFDSTTSLLTGTMLANLSSQVNSTLNKGTYNGTFTYSNLRDDGRIVTISSLTYNSAQATITISNITVNGSTTIYFVAVGPNIANPSI